jgi:argonaute-like protein implicated in RNA metabolism and viral defense
MERLVQRLNRGSMRYPGAHKTFGSEMEVSSVLACQDIGEYDDAIRDFSRTDSAKETNVALVFLPKDAGAIDLKHPYYSVKGQLLKEGIVSQMVDRTTLYNPEWRDLNLALNIYAKAGHTPWVLDEALPGADLFIGLSSSVAKRGQKVVKMMSYVNVFDSYGRWKFYEGDSKAFEFDDRLNHYEKLVKESLAAYKAEKGTDIRNVHIHLTKPFSAQERRVISAAIRTTAPEASVIFVSINSHHVVRMYDLSEANDGRVTRSTYLVKMGTPIPLELTLWADPPEALPAVNQIGQQVLSLTRLNWASTRSFCHEPITTKYAGDIAKLMTAFMEDPEFSVNTRLRGVPWFL